MATASLDKSIRIWDVESGKVARTIKSHADIVSALVGHGIAVSELAEVPPDLERVFLDLTRRPAKEAPASEEASKEAA